MTEEPRSAEQVTETVQQGALRSHYQLDLLLEPYLRWGP
jgi:hypothetical protein